MDPFKYVIHTWVQLNATISAFTAPRLCDIYMTFYEEGIFMKDWRAATLDKNNIIKIFSLHSDDTNVTG